MTGQTEANSRSSGTFPHVPSSSINDLPNSHHKHNTFRHCPTHLRRSSHNTMLSHIVRDHLLQKESTLDTPLPRDLWQGSHFLAKIKKVSFVFFDVLWGVVFFMEFHCLHSVLSKTVSFFLDLSFQFLWFHQAPICFLEGKDVCVCVCVCVTL